MERLKSLPCWAKIGIAVLVTVFFFNFPRSSSEWAAWVQAYGSIGAVVAAIFIMKSQMDRNEASEIKEQKKAIRRNLVVAQRCVVYMKSSSHVFFDGNKQATNSLYGTKGLRLAEVKQKNVLKVLLECVSSESLSPDHIFNILKASDASLGFLYLFDELKNEKLDNEYIELVVGRSLTDLGVVDEYLKKEISMIG